MIDKNAEKDYRAALAMSQNEAVCHWVRGNCFPDNRHDVKYFIEIMENYLIQDSLNFTCLLGYKIQRVQKIVDNLYKIDSFLKGSL